MFDSSKTWLKKKRQNLSKRHLEEFMATLSSVDDYGLPPTSMYQRFNSVGADYHGQCAMALGSAGFSLGFSAGFKLGELIPRNCPIQIKFGASIDLNGDHLASSAVVLFRLPSGSDGHDDAELTKYPLCLAQLDGVCWSGKAALSAKAGTGIGFTDHIGNLSLGAKAGANVSYESTVLVADTTQCFGDHSRAALYRAVDHILLLEIKKAVASYLASRKSGFLNPAEPGRAKKALTELVTITPLLAAKKTAEAIDDTKAGKAAPLKPSKIAKIVIDGPPAIKKLLSAFMDSNADFLDQDLKVLKKKIDRHINANTPPSVPAAGEALADDIVKELIINGDYINYLRDRLLREVIFPAGDQGLAPPGKQFNANDLTRKDLSSLSLTSFDYGVEGDVTAKAQLINKRTQKKVQLDGGTNEIIDVDTAFELTGGQAKAQSGLMGRRTNFRFQLVGEDGLMMTQDTHTNYFQMSMLFALKFDLATTGVSEVDKKVKKVALAADFRSPGRRRFGALTYRSATAYWHKRSSGRSNNGRPLTGISGVNLGVSLRVGRLCFYAESVRKLNAGENFPANSKLSRFEKWVSDHLAVTPQQLRKFVLDAPLGREYVNEDGTPKKGAYVSDCLLVESSFGQRKGSLPVGLLSNDIPVNLFDYFDYQGQQKLRNDVVSKSHPVEIQALRLRYRIQSPHSRTSKNIMPLGIPPEATAGVSLKFAFDQVHEVGQESIVDLHTVFFGPRLDQIDMYECSVPPTVLFNRG